MTKSREEPQADIWTKLAVAAETFHGLIDNLMFFAPTLDNLCDWPSDTPIGVSERSIWISSVLSLAVTLGTAYCSYLINVSHQGTAALPAIDLEAQAQPLLVHKPKLTWLQQAAVVANYVGHAAEVAGPANYLTSAITSDRLSRWGEVGTNCAMMSLGFFCSVATYRTARNAALESDKGTTVLPLSPLNRRAGN